MEGKCYAVRHGRNPGIYDTWDQCKKQVSFLLTHVIPSLGHRFPWCIIQEIYQQKRCREIFT